MRPCHDPDHPRHAFGAQRVAGVMAGASAQRWLIRSTLGLEQARIIVGWEIDALAYRVRHERVARLWAGRIPETEIYDYLYDDEMGRADERQA